MAELKDKRYAVTIGMAIYPNNVQPLTAAPLYYGKLNYESMVQVQGVLAKHQARFTEFMEPLVKELQAMGIMQAEVVAESRKGGSKEEGNYGVNPNGLIKSR